MIIISSSDFLSSQRFHELSQKLDAEWNGVEFSANNHNGQYRIIRYVFFEHSLIIVGEMNSNLTVNLKGSKKKQDRITLRIIYEGIPDSNNQTKTLNEILLYNGNQNFDLIIPKEKPIKWITVSFPTETFDFLAEKDDFELKKLIHKKTNWFTYFSITPEIESLIRTIFESRDKKVIRRSIFFAKAIELFGLLRLKLDEIKFGVSTNKSGQEIEQMMKLKDYILMDYSTPKRLIDLADKMNMSESTLQRSFKEIFNMPIMQFFNQKRLEEAHRQIKYSNKNITEISIDLGYTHIHQFSSSFKKYFGYPPSALRTN